MTNARIYEARSIGIPTLQLDANGKATIEYYTPDSTAPEDITIEGVDKTERYAG